MKMKVYYHDNCFDGLASAAVFSNFYRYGIRQNAEFEYEGLAHRAGQLFIDVRFDGDENAIVDFKYSSDPRLTWWFDHHQSAFLNEEDAEHFRRDTSGRKLYDPPVATDSSVNDTLKSKLKSLRPDDAHGKLHPIRSRYASSFCTDCSSSTRRMRGACSDMLGLCDGPASGDPTGRPGLRRL